MGILKFGSVCSGIEAASVAWEVLGWEAAWLAEIEPFPSAVLAHHWPNVPNLGDMTKIAEWVKLGFVEAPDVLVGGTPCQAFSVAGVRNSLDDDRGQLSLEFIKIADELDAQRETPSIIVWENVPGVLNTKDNAFGCFLGGLSGAGEELQPSGKKWTNAGYVSGPKRAVAWRILDAQHFGVAQRRRRVFVVASARKDCNPAEVLFESQGLRRDSPPSRNSGQEVTRGISESPYLPSGFRMTAFGQYADDETASTMKQRDYKDATDLVVGTLDTQCGFAKAAFQSVMSGHIVVHGTQDPITLNNQAFPLGRNQGQENAVFGIPGNWIGRKPENGGNATEPMNNIAPRQTKTDRHAVATYSLADHATPKSNEEICFTLNARDFKGSPCINDVSVRRLTPIECERLQGFPDNHTKVPYRNKSAEDCPDGPRYAACGNSMAVPVMRWVGRRINEVLSNARAV